ncbi:inorganic pyrophosphatase [Phycomyces nitens]|nr:inorganic pyrophosphatase [Phycomyces nitens]
MKLGSLGFLYAILAVNLVSGANYTVRPIGAPYSKDYVVYIEKDGLPISPFHDIPLFADRNNLTMNMVIEIPRWTNAKYEINKETPLNPIKQDIKDDQPRFSYNIFPYKGYPWNYGALPQTWEDSGFITPEFGTTGDNDPIDVIEIGDKIGYTGEVKPVKILGVIGLIDQNETDWKVVAVDANDTNAPNLNDIGDVENIYPGLLKAIIDYLTKYKVPGGDALNKFMFDGKAQNKEYAIRQIMDTHKYWKELVSGDTKGKEIEKANLFVKGSPYRVLPDSDLVQNIPASNPLPALPIDPKFEKWYYV